jgi:hypothetical protein
MKTRNKLIASAALLAVLTAPASARFDGDEGGASAYPRFTKERNNIGQFRSASYYLINRPFQQRWCAFEVRPNSGGVQPSPVPETESHDSPKQSSKERVMKTLAVLATLAAAAFVTSAAAQTSGNHREMMASMKAQHPETFASCQALAVRRGYNDNDRESDGVALMHFIHGCIMGQQR